ncbi:MAG: ABC transporter permease, partial [Kiloniellales bacterium]
MVFGAFERLVAMRYLRARRHEGFISVVAAVSLVGIALGVATLIIVMAVMNGFRQELLGRILGVNGHLTIHAIEGTIADYDALAGRLAALEGVVAVAPQVQAQVMVSRAGNARGALVRGLTRDDLVARPLIVDNLVAGSLDDFAAGQGVLIGNRLAQRLRLSPGDEITLVSPRGNQTVLGTLPRVKSYPIAGLFEVGMYEYDSSFVYMPLADAQTFFRLPERVNAIEIFFADADRVSSLSPVVADELGPGYRIVDWQQANSSFFNAIQVERNVMFL